MTKREARGGALIVGGGLAGGYVARYMGTRGATIISPENFKALHADAAGGLIGGGPDTPDRAVERARSWR